MDISRLYCFTFEDIKCCLTDIYMQNLYSRKLTQVYYHHYICNMNMILR